MSPPAFSQNFDFWKVFCLFSRSSTCNEISSSFVTGHQLVVINKIERSWTQRPYPLLFQECRCRRLVASCCWLLLPVKCCCVPPPGGWRRTVVVQVSCWHKERHFPQANECDMLRSSRNAPSLPWLLPCRTSLLPHDDSCGWSFVMPRFP
jgi:hypothetical protein